MKDNMMRNVYSVSLTDEKGQNYYEGQHDSGILCNGVGVYLWNRPHGPYNHSITYLD